MFPCAIRTTALLTLTSLALPTLAGEFVMTVSGSFRSFTSDSASFDGTDTTTLDPLFDTARLDGGTFRATYRFSDVPATSTSSTLATYDFSAGSGMTYELLDAQGNLVHRGTQPTSSAASVINNGTLANGSVVDVVSFYGFVNQVSGLTVPTPRFSPLGQLDALSSVISFNGAVDGTTDFLTSFTLPTDSAVYRAFPNARFETEMFYGEGDFENGAEPFQYVDTILTYDIDAVTVTAVPTPGPLGILALGGVIDLRRRRSR